MSRPEAELVCPLCQQPNNCGAKSSADCWCKQDKFPPALIAQVEAIAPGRSRCICLNCLQQFIKSTGATP